MERIMPLPAQLIRASNARLNYKVTLVFSCIFIFCPLLLAAPLYRVVPLEPSSVDDSMDPRFFGYEGLDNAGNAYVNVIDENQPNADYEQRWNGTTLSGYLPDQSFGVKSISLGGQVVLQTFSGEQETTQSAIWTASGGLTTLSAPSNLAGWSLYAQNSNKCGYVAGTAWNGDNSVTPHVVTWSPDGTPHDLGVPATGNTNPMISDSGVLYGDTDILQANTFAGQSSVGFVGWGNNMQLITVPGFDAVYVPGLNASGEALVKGISGATVLSSFTKSFVWSSGVLTPLPDVPGSPAYFAGQSVAMAINDSGTIVGSQGEAALWDSNLTPYSINDLLMPDDETAWTIDTAYDINDSGDILASADRNGVDANGLPYLPEPVMLVLVPEPSSAATVLTVVLLIGARRRR